MSRRTNASSTGMSLFPFLDVLICTMGSLILLLVVITKKVQPAIAEKARQAAIAAKLDLPPPEVPVEESPATAESNPPSDDDSLSQWRTQIEALAAERDDARQQLTALERRLVAAQGVVLRTQEQAASKQDRLKAARGTQQQTEADRERLRREVVAMRGELAAAEQRLVDAKEQQQTAKSKFAFVPFDGRSGTTRRPILIECTDQAIRFVPEDVKLTPSDLNGFTGGFNPLLIASRELVHYWNAYDRVHADSEENNQANDDTKDLLSYGSQGKQPYVLLLVRPKGAVSFHIAKGLLAQLKIPHGYELLDEDMDLELAEPDPDAKRICEQAIEQTLAEREKVLQVLAQNRDLQRDQLQLKPGSSTFVTVEQPNETVGSRPAGAGGTGARLSGNGTSATGSAGKNLVPSNGSPAGRNPADSGSISTDRTNPSFGSSGTPLRPTSTANGIPTAGGPPASDFGSSEHVGDPSGRSSLKASQQSKPSQQAKSARSLPSGDGSADGDEPPEEPLPQQAARRFEDDDSKPFPLGHADRSAGTSSKPVSSANRGASSPGGVPDAGATQRSNGSTQPNPGASGQRSSGGSDMRKYKRKYAMPRSGIGIEKAIPIRVWSNRIVVHGEFEIPVDAGVRTESLVERVLIAMDRVQSDWPSAGDGYYWVPTLKYEVVPGGDQVQQRLNSALFDLGLVSSVTYLNADPDKAAKPKPSVSPKKPGVLNDDQSTPPPPRSGPPSKKMMSSGSLAPSPRGLGKGVFGGALTVGGTR